MRKYKTIAFDLDDTLLDTSGLLVPEASRQACEILLSAGVQCQLDECMQMRQELALSLPHTQIFSRIAKHFGATNIESDIQRATSAFYNPRVPDSLPLIPGALDNILKLKNTYNLYLVTAGAHETQMKKIKALSIEHHFQKVFIMNGFKGEKKDIAFKEILQRERHSAGELLSVGNRLSSEIREGKRVGADTCYFAFGEHLGEKPELPEDHPDFTIAHHEELISTCRL